MKTRAKLALFAAAILAVALFHSRLTRACGPFFPQIIFINTVHPDLPVGEFAAGNLGIIQPTYGTIYLYVAYRNLAGRPLSPDEQTALWDNDQRLLAGQGMWSGDFLQKQQDEETKGNTNWAQKWGSATGQSLESARLSYGYGSNYQPWAGIYSNLAIHASWGVYYNQYLNCPQDAFRSAVSTLRRLTQQFGGDSPVVKDWIQAQQTVFGNCSGGNAIPAPLPPGAPAVAQADRNYQIAAAHFYSGGYDLAATDFRAISQDTSSPWSIIAPYLVARSLVRKATMVEKEEPDLAALAQAEAQVDSILSDPRYAKYYAAAERLRGFIEFRLHPRQRLIELANNMTKVSGDPNLAQDAIDFKLLFPRVEISVLHPEPAKDGDHSMTPGEVQAKSDLLDWMITLQLGGPEAYTHSFEKWKRTNSLAWLVAALMKATPESPYGSELLAAAGKVPTSSVSFDSVTFYSLRLMLLQGKGAEVRSRLARLDINGRRPSGLSPPRSVVNQYLAMRFELARNLDELFASAGRVPAMVSDTSEGGDMPAAGSWGIDPSEARLDDDAVMVFNRFLPVALLARAVHNPKLAENLRREIAVAAWTRAALLGDSAVARSLGPAVENLVPQLSASVRSYDSAKTPAERRFAAVLAALRFPGLRPFVETYGRADWNGATPIDQINNYRMNWWGTEGPQCTPAFLYSHIGQPGYSTMPHWPQVGQALQTLYPGGKVKPPAFLTAKEQAEAAREWQRLLDMSPAPDYLAAEAIAWGRAHPSDPRVPEALALAVKATRFGCTDPKTGERSKAAFDLLHSRYPNSSWTAQTKYWFKM
ncbi:MAG TPA: hypothetical protein VNM47_10055 [Terriglobia bacterium]|nr:hypothetical protein [Terriglobia bacterium]